MSERGESIERQQYELELHGETALEHLLRVAQRSLEIQEQILQVSERNNDLLQEIVDDLAPSPTFPTAIAFMEGTMNPTEAGQSQVFTGTLTPAGATYPADTTFTLTSNDPDVAPTVDSTGLIVSVTYPAGWVESA